MARGRKKSNDGPSIPAWILTYGDMMSLLLTFFILIAAMSSISKKDFTAAMLSIQTQLNVLPKHDGVITLVNRTERKTPRQVEKLARRLQREMQVMGKDKDIEVQFDKEGGLKIVLPNAILFDTARADLKPEASPVLEAVGGLLNELQGVMFEIRGHTDGRPLTSSGRFRDNYDLSYARADTVARWFASSGRIPLEQFEIISCGPSQPVAANDTEEGLRQNRRVEIFVRAAADSSKMEELKGRIDAIEKAGATPES
jgi:chemotaxis protein MotB